MAKGLKPFVSSGPSLSSEVSWPQVRRDLTPTSAFSENKRGRCRRQREREAKEVDGE